MTLFLLVITAFSFVSWIAFWAGFFNEGIEAETPETRIIAALTGLVWMTPLALTIGWICGS